MPDAEYTQVLAQLRDALVRMRSSIVHSQIVEPQTEVFGRFQPIFAVDHIPNLTEDEFRPFLYFENNHHWTGLHRQVNRLCADMPGLRRSLLLMLDESRSIEDRLDDVALNGITGMGKGIMTAILHVAHPHKYGVWNNVSEGALVMLGIYPDFARGASFGKRYEVINALLNQIAKTLEIDLWKLDALWWFIQQGDALPRAVAGAFVDGPSESLPPTPVQPLSMAATIVTETGTTFGLERHLHDFLYDNWDRLDLGRDWKIHSEPGDEDAGYEYPCRVGRIDILAKHRREKKWLVIELKRNDTTDMVVGQVLRYMGWVRQHLAEAGDEVRGLIIAREGDVGLQYAISNVPSLSFLVYQVEFRLATPPDLREGEK